MSKPSRVNNPCGNGQPFDPAGFLESGNGLPDFFCSFYKNEPVVHAVAFQNDIVTAETAPFDDDQGRYPALSEPFADEGKKTCATKSCSCQAEKNASGHIQVRKEKKHKGGYDDEEESDCNKNEFKRYHWEPYEWGNLLYAAFFFANALLVFHFLVPDKSIDWVLPAEFHQRIVSYEILMYMLMGIYFIMEGFSYVEKEIFLGGEKSTLLIRSLGERFSWFFFAVLLIPALVYGIAGPLYMIFPWMGIFLLAILFFNCFIITTVKSLSVAMALYGVFNILAFVAAVLQ